MVSHAQTDNVAVVSYAGAPKSAAPLTGASGIAEQIVSAFASNEALDLALITNVGIPAADVLSMTQNDKIYVLRKYLDEGGTITTAGGGTLPAPIIEAASAPVAQIAPWGTVWVDESGVDVYQSNGDGTWATIFEE